MTRLAPILLGLTFVMSVAALVLALWPVVADAPWEDGVTEAELSEIYAMLVGNIKQYDTFELAKKYLYIKGIISETLYNNAKIYHINAEKSKIISQNEDIINFNFSEPMKITPTLIGDDNSNELYFIQDNQFILSDYDSVITTVYNEDLNKKVDQIIIDVFKINSDDTADIKLDYINKIDMIDKINFNIKQLNIIKGA